jgi:hypothetical protein
MTSPVFSFPHVYPWGGCQCSSKVQKQVQTRKLKTKQKKTNQTQKSLLFLAKRLKGDSVD